jgi:hypothetical protein
LFIALLSGRAKEIYQRNYNHFNAANNAIPIEDQASDAEVLKVVVNETAKSFFDSWDTAVQEQQQYMRQNLFIGDSKPSVFIERLKRMNKMLQYYPRANVFDDDNVFIEEEQLISIVHHVSHGIMQLQIQRAGRTINEFKTLEDLKVFFTQQHDCDMLEKRILTRDSNNKNKKQKKTKKKPERKTKTTMPMMPSREIESPPRSRNASIVAKSGTAMTIAGLSRRTRKSGRQIIVLRTPSPRNRKWLWRLSRRALRHFSPKNKCR